MVNPEELESLLWEQENRWNTSVKKEESPKDQIAKDFEKAFPTLVVQDHLITSCLGTRFANRMYIFVYIPEVGLTPHDMAPWRQSFRCEMRTSSNVGPRNWNETLTLKTGAIIKVFASHGAENDAEYFEVGTGSTVNITADGDDRLCVSGNLRLIPSDDYKKYDLPSLRHRYDFKLKVEALA